MPAIIKADQVVRLSSQMGRLNLRDHVAEARSIVASARKTAAQILADAEGRAAALVAQSREQGYRDGYAKSEPEGFEAGKRAGWTEVMERFAREQEPLVNALKRTVDQLDAMKNDLRINAERGLLEFAVKLACKLTYAIGTLYRDAVRENFRRALDSILVGTNVKVRVHPSDLAAMESYAEELVLKSSHSSVVSVWPDDTLSPGGCVVETGATRVDATLETQLDELVRLLLGCPVEAV